MPIAGAGAAVTEVVCAAVGAGHTPIVILAVVAGPEFKIDGVDSGSRRNASNVGKNGRVRGGGGVIGARIVEELTRGHIGQSDPGSIGRERAHRHIDPLRRAAGRHQFKIIGDASERAREDTCGVVYRIGNGHAIPSQRVRGDGEFVNQRVPACFRDVRQQPRRPTLPDSAQQSHTGHPQTLPQSGALHDRTSLLAPSVFRNSPAPHQPSSLET